MKTYLVGGAVRDQLLGRPVKERDWVVVGATEQDMLDAGYRSVGRDFPVFLHPVTHEEYALARTERKTGPGHQGFVCHASPDVTLEEDLQRRDLTINAIAQDESGELIDPWGGKADLADKCLRHVSDAFAEDPLRILRIARFSATFPGFHIHPETRQMLETMVAGGALNELTPERVLMELDKALAAAEPARFFDVLADLGANQLLWPELNETAFERLQQLESSDVETRFACLFQDSSEETVTGFCRRYRTSNQRQEITSLVVTHVATWRAIADLTAGEVVDLLYATDAFRKRERFLAFDQVCTEITRQSSRWLPMLDVAAAVTATDIDSSLSGPEIGAAIRAERVRVITEMLQ